MSDAWIETVDPRRRVGIKGPRAAELLAALDIAVPSQANHWAPLRASDPPDSAALVARLGFTEFFLEEPGDAPGIAALERRLAGGEAGVYSVLREDAAFVVGGRGAPAALAEVCNVDFASLAPPQLVMTLMIGVGVLALPQLVAGEIRYRIWCDPSFGQYLASELQAVVARTTTGRAQ